MSVEKRKLAVVKCVDLCAGYARRSNKPRSSIFSLHNLLQIRQVIGPFTHRVMPGTLTGVVGDNGAGKSTLLKTLASSLPILSGTISSSAEASSIVELGSPPSPWMTGREYVQDYFRLQKLLKHLPQSVTELTEQAEAFASIGDAFDQPLAIYSSGMRARVLFSAAFSGPTPYILLDEILSVGDAVFTAKCWRLLQRKLSEGMSGYLVTHDWSSVLRLCNECIWLENGMVKMLGTPHSVVSAYLNNQKEFDDPVLSDLSLESFNLCTSSSSLTLSFSCTVETDEPLLVAVSIEDIGQGRGWQILALTDLVPLVQSASPRINISLSPILIASGNYEACLFIKGALPSSSINQAYSWVNGYSMPIHISSQYTTHLQPYITKLCP